MMKVGVEFDFVVPDSLEALALYEQIFEIEREEVTDFSRGQNEVIFTLYGTRFHMLDENPKFNLIAPKPGQAQSSWVNVLVPDIKKTYEKALELGCAEVQSVNEIRELGISNAVFSDPYGYVWMLHQIHREISKEELHEFWEKMSENQSE